jgi:hypothetical protein
MTTQTVTELHIQLMASLPENPVAGRNYWVEFKVAGKTVRTMGSHTTRDSALEYAQQVEALGYEATVMSIFDCPK